MHHLLTIIIAIISKSSGWVLGLFKARKETLSERRTNCPFFQPSTTRFNILFYERGNGNIDAISPTNPALLCWSRNEVAIKPDKEQVVYFVIDNNGAFCPHIRIKLNGETVALEREPKMQSANGLSFLVYPYHVSEHGKDQRLAVTFQSLSGVSDTHTYLTRHGIRFLERIDPALP